MLVEASLQRSVKRCDDKGADKCREDRVRREDREVYRPRKSFTSKLSWSESEVIGPQCMMSEIGHKEER